MVDHCWHYDADFSDPEDPDNVTQICCKDGVPRYAELTNPIDTDHGDWIPRVREPVWVYTYEPEYDPECHPTASGRVPEEGE